MSLSDFAEMSTAGVAKAFKLAAPHKQGQYFAEVFALMQEQNAAKDAEIADLRARAEALEAKLAE